MINRVTSTIAAVSVFAAIGVAVTANAEDPKNQPGENMKPSVAIEQQCAGQAWPSFDANCLLTLEGEPANREFRTVAAY